mmetsp:Transcript_9647/g.14886  ORF Transcript_9647/g.14886 Transcript_9647/m.14886 type:complete len:229 (-) Transcript_9647:102-788(-)
MLKYSIISLFAVLALINLSHGEEHVARKLGYYSKCKTVLDLNDRCCGDDLSACECPVRECKKWYCGWIQRKWDYKCNQYEEDAPDCTIPKVAEEAKAFGTLLAAVGAAGLGDALSGDDDLTLFAPTDDAFAALPDGLVTCLLEEGNKDLLTEILLYHVVAGKVLSSDLTNGATVETLSGQTVAISLEGGVFINDSEVIAADIGAFNGVIHKIDKVLVPASFTGCPAAE